MKSNWVLLAAGAVLLSTAAEAKRVSWCEINSRVGNYKLWSAIMELGDSDADYLRFRDETFGPAFRQYVLSLEGDAPKAECNIRSSLKEAQEDMDKIIRANPGMSFRKTDWSGGFPRASGGVPEPAGSGQALTVKKVQIGTDPEILEDVMLKAQRAGAQAMAKAIADGARQRAEMDAKFKKFMAELKKRGSAQ